MSYLEETDWRRAAVGVSDGHRLIGGPAPAGDDVFSRMEPAILETLHRLDTLPRDHPFWRNTNKRPTIYKLRDFCEMVLRENPADEGALWCQAALSVSGCDNLFGFQFWKLLHGLGKLQVRWPIEAACLVQLMSGVPTIEPLVVLLWELELQEEGRAALLELYPSDSAIYQWATMVVPLLAKRPSERWWNSVREWRR
jgi:hypothetical protein